MYVLSCQSCVSSVVSFVCPQLSVLCVLSCQFCVSTVVSFVCPQLSVLCVLSVSSVYGFLCLKSISIVSFVCPQLSVLCVLSCQFCVSKTNYQNVVFFHRCFITHVGFETSSSKLLFIFWSDKDHKRHTQTCMTLYN